MTSFLHQYAKDELLVAFERSERLSFHQNAEEITRLELSRKLSQELPDISPLARKTSGVSQPSLFQAEISSAVEVIEITEVERREPEPLPKLSSLVVGSSMHFQLDIDGATEWQSWGQARAEGFQVRAGPNYSKSKRKLPSLQSLYDLVACDYIRNIDANGDKLNHIASKMTLPE